MDHAQLATRVAAVIIERLQLEVRLFLVSQYIRGLIVGVQVMSYRRPRSVCETGLFRRSRSGSRAVA